MKSFFYHRFNRTLLLFTLLATSMHTLNGQGFSHQTETRLQKVLDSFYSDRSNPMVGGMSAAINVDGLSFWQGATGFASRYIDDHNNLLEGGKQFNTGTLSRIYSITKTFTAPLVLQLAKESYFSLDDAIKKYLPDIEKEDVNPNQINTSVTIRQLLNHTSGYSDWEEEFPLQMKIFMAPYLPWKPIELVAYTHQLSTPGSVSRYSHNNYVFLGAIMEAATQMKVEDLYRKKFFEPLHLSSTYFEGREEFDKSLLADPHDNLLGQFSEAFPKSYTNIRNFPMDAIVSLAYTGGALVSNVADIAAWGNALFGGRATDKAVLETMLNSISPVPDEYGNRLGYGIKLYNKISAPNIFLGHNGSAPGYRSVIIYNQERKMTIAILSNFAGIDPYMVAEKLFEALPQFTGGNENRKEDKIILCWNGKNITVARQAADGLIKKGAYLGSCSQSEVKSGKPLTAHNDNQYNEQNNLTAAPNPFYNKVAISFKTVQSGPVNLSVYDIYGKLVATPFSGVMEKNVVRNLEWNTGNLPAGIYFCRLQTASGLSELRLVSKR